MVFRGGKSAAKGGAKGPSSAPLPQIQDTAGTQYLGIVKTYHGKKGFGFITADGFDGDVLFSRNELPDDAKEVRGNFIEGRSVTFAAEAGPDGRCKATSMLIPAEDGKCVPGVIKSYSPNHDYGFVSSSSLTDDVRFDKMSFRALQDIQLVPGVNLKGQLVLVLPKQMPDGKTRAEEVRFQTKHIGDKLRSHGGSHAAFGGGQFAMIAAAAANSGPQSGIVKSFSEKNGYGFINIPGQQMDVLFRKQAVVGGDVEEGSMVQFSMTMSAQGKAQATQVMLSKGNKRSVGHVAMGGSPMKMARIADTPTGQHKKGTIKSYNATKGFGFITGPGVNGDVFFMRTSLPLEVQDTQLDGQAVSYELVRAADGKSRAQSITFT